jgi:molybdopterin biosynthesis enzyme
VAPVPPRAVPLAAAIGRVLAREVRAPGPVPAGAVALREGWAVDAAATLGASPYGPVPLPAAPRWLRAGEALPAGTDALLGAFDLEESPIPQALQAVAPGDGIRRAGEDFLTGDTLARAGRRLRAQDLPGLLACGIAQVAARAPGVTLLDAGTGLGPVLAALVAAEGGDAAVRDFAPEALAGAAGDAVIVLGGLGESAEDPAPRALAAAGRLLAHGLAARPGLATAIGRLGPRPVLLLPDGAADALAGWWLLGRPLLRHLAGVAARAPGTARLTRKVASAIGLADLVPLAFPEPGLAEPLAVGALPLGVLARAEALLVVPPGAEGYEAGSTIPFDPL